VRGTRTGKQGGRCLGVLKLKVEGASEREWWDHTVLPSLLGGYILTRGGRAEWGR